MVLITLWTLSKCRCSVWSEPTPTPNLQSHFHTSSTPGKANPHRSLYWLLLRWSPNLQLLKSCRQPGWKHRKQQFASYLLYMPVHLALTIILWIILIKLLKQTPSAKHIHLNQTHSCSRPRILHHKYKCVFYPYYCKLRPVSGKQAYYSGWTGRAARLSWRSGHGHVPTFRMRTYCWFSALL